MVSVEVYKNVLGATVLGNNKPGLPSTLLQKLQNPSTTDSRGGRNLKLQGNLKGGEGKGGVSLPDQPSAFFHGRQVMREILFAARGPPRRGCRLGPQFSPSPPPTVSPPIQVIMFQSFNSLRRQCSTFDSFQGPGRGVARNLIWGYTF